MYRRWLSWICIHDTRTWRWVCFIWSYTYNHNWIKRYFVYSLNNCITHLYKDVPLNEQIPRELIIAQAAIETGWGKSRFANEGNNLFGIRTWNKDVPYLLPIPWTEWPGWGVKVFKTKCDSVAHYINIINEVYAYAEFREVRAKILEHGEVPNGLDLAPTLTKYASRSNYTDLIAELIKYNIRGVYELWWRTILETSR